jgi:biopolymer transport protein ExbD
MSAREEIGINRVVTPMLDMTFQLLFYFIFNFHPPIAEGQIDLSLPAASQENLEQPEAAGRGLEPAEADEYTIAVYAPHGFIDLLTFRVRNFDAEALPVNGGLKALEARLRGIPKPKDGNGFKPPILKIEADNKLRYAELMMLISLCRELGLSRIDVQPLPPRHK